MNLIGRIYNRLKNLDDGDCTTGPPDPHQGWPVSAEQRKLDASCTPEQAAISVARERKAMTDRERYYNMTTEERCRLQGDGFINDYD